MSVMKREIFKVKINSSVVSIHQERQHLTRIYKIINKNAVKRGPNINNNNNNNNNIYLKSNIQNSSIDYKYK